MKRFAWTLGVLLGLGLVGGLPAPGSGESPTGESLVQLREISVEARDEGLAVQIKTSGPAAYETALIDTPTRLVIDLESTGYGWRKTPLLVGMDPLRTIRGSQFKKSVSRVVLELSRKVGYRIDEGPEGLTVTLEPSSTLVAPARAESKPVEVAKVAPQEEKPAEVKPAAEAAPPVAKAPVPKPPEPPAVAKAEAPKPPEPKAAEIAKESEAPKVEPAKPAAPALAERAPRQPVVAAPAARAPIRLAQAPQAQQPPATNGARLISLDFKDADIVNLLRILAAESGRNIVSGEDVRGKVSISLQNVTWELALEVILEARGLQKVEKDGVIRIVSSEQLTKEREARARAEEAKVKGEAEARAKLAEAEVKEADAKQRKLQAEAAIAEAQARGPLREETIRLKYADPEDVAKTLQGILGIPEGGVAATSVPLRQPGVTPSVGLGGPPPIAEPPFAQLYGQPGAAGAPVGAPVSASAEVLAKGITIRAHKPTNSIFLRLYANDLERIKKLITETLDVLVPQVKIEARMEILDRPSLLDIGIQWSGAGTKRLNDRNILLGQGSAIRFAPTGIRPGPPPIFDPAAPINPNLNLDNFLPVAPTTGLPTGGNLVSLPLQFAQSTLGTLGPAGSINFGIVGTRFNLNLALQALEVKQKTKTLARPEIVTVENKTAQMSLGEEIPYSTVSSAGTQVQFKEAVLKLEVTPTVIREPDGNKIKMKVIVENNTRGQVTGGIPAIDKRRAETEVIVKEGEILVIGGVTQRQTRESTRKVPILGDIPLLGWLFKIRSEEDDPNRELVIFIAPSVVKGGAPVQSTKPITEKPKGS